MPDEVKWITGIVALVSIIIFGGLGIATVLDRNNCDKRGEITGFSTAYDWPTGCYIRINDRWIPYDKWREIQP